MAVEAVSANKEDGPKKKARQCMRTSQPRAVILEVKFTGASIGILTAIPSSAAVAWPLPRSHVGKGGDTRVSSEC